MKSAFLFLLLFSTLAYGSSAYIPAAQTLGEGGREFSFQAEVFQTVSVVNEVGEAFSLQEGTSYQRTDFDFTAGFGFTEEFEGYFGLRSRFVQAVDNFSGEESTYNQLGLNSAVIGFKYGFKEDNGVKFTLEGFYRNAFFENEDYQGEASPSTITMGDDTRSYALGVNAYSRSRSNNFLTARIFYRDPSQKLSSEIFSQIDYNLAWNYFSFGVGVENNYSLESDSYSGDPENKPQTYNGPSEYFNSVNRSWTAPYLQMNISFGGPWRLESRYTQVMTGNSTDKGPRVMIALVKRTSKNKNLENFKKADSNFKQYRTEGLVTKVSKKRDACLIDKGVVHGVAAGQQVDFYHFDYVDGDKLIGSGIVVKTQASKSLVKIVRKYDKKRVEDGTVARIQQLN